MNIYTIRDDVAQFFIAPFTAHNNAHAQRMFIVGLGDSFPHRKDFSLYCVGQFDEENGLVQALDPKLVMTGVSIDVSLDPRVYDPTKDPRVQTKEHSE